MMRLAVDSRQAEKIRVFVCRMLSDTKALYVFGSAASGQMTDASDVDLAVLAPGPIAPHDHAVLREKLEDFLRRDVQLIDLCRASTVMRAQVVTTGVLLYDGDPSFRERYEDHVYSAYARLNEERRAILQRIRCEGKIHG